MSGYIKHTYIWLYSVVFGIIFTELGFYLSFKFAINIYVIQLIYHGMNLESLLKRIIWKL